MYEKHANNVSYNKQFNNNYTINEFQDITHFYNITHNTKDHI